jgi:hypothetical protein
MPFKRLSITVTGTAIQVWMKSLRRVAEPLMLQALTPERKVL